MSRMIRPKSNGLPVRRSTAFHIRSADRARARQDWHSAAAGYRSALANEPHLHHLWIQLGHMEKEAGAIDQATAAYEKAARLRTADVEPLLRLGHMAKAWRQPCEAATYFVRALQRDPNNLQAVAELARLLPDRSDMTDELWSASVTVLNIDPESLHLDKIGYLPLGSMLFDVTDLLTFFGQRRLPTGIQRVQIEISLALLAGDPELQPMFCVYSSARRGWIGLPHSAFRNLCYLARQSDDIEDPAWTGQLDQIYRTVAISRTLFFVPETVLINLGTSWSDRNYLLDVRTARVRDQLIYVPLVFDLIPLIKPEWFIESLVREYRAWFGALLHSADGCIAISHATHRDLVEKSALWHAPMSSDTVPVVQLNGDFRQASASIDILHDYGLKPEKYVLLVSTLEPRKNHIGAFRAWLKLADTLEEKAVPLLVCVGGRGWLNDDLHAMLADEPRLQRMVLILHGVPDDKLATLYEHCLFALYPSFYEGWGLPVSEALSYNKVPAISDISSLPEAGGCYARYFNPQDVDSIAATVMALLDDEKRQDAQAVILQNYKPRTWLQIAQELVTKAKTVPPRIQDSLPQIAGPGRWSLSLQKHILNDTSIGDSLRHGRSWLSPTTAGCGIAGDDAALCFYWSGISGAHLHIQTAAPDSVFSFIFNINGVCYEVEGVDGGRFTASLALPSIPGPVQVMLKPAGLGFVVEGFTITQEKARSLPSESATA
ncbi:glycosyltransferase [Sphingobium limneticum]